MTFIEYLSISPVCKTWLISTLVLIIFFIIVSIICFKNRSEGCEESVKYSLIGLILCIGLHLLFLIVGYFDYNKVQRAIDDNYAVYIDGERSFTTSPREAIENSTRTRFNIDEDHGWILCVSKQENEIAVEYFAQFGKEVPKQ